MENAGQNIMPYLQKIQGLNNLQGVLCPKISPFPITMA